jgi:glycosyltransferase involved in cell wall biosynthesis
VAVYRLPPTGRGQLKKWGLILTSVPKLFTLRHEFDLIFVSGFRIVGISAVLMSKWLQKRCILKADSQGEMSGEFFDHGLKRLHASSRWLPFRLFLSLRNRILRQADAHSAISADIAAELAASGIPNKALHIIPNSVNTERFFPSSAEQKQQLRRLLGLPAAATILIYTGRLVSYKGLPLLLEVWQAIVKKYQPLHLILAGTGGLDMHNCEAELRSFVRERHLESSVLFTGNVPNVSEYLQAADIFVFPTENDAFPSSLVEAMACALPVVTTPVGAIKDIVNDAQTGMLVEPGNFQELYHALETLIEDPSRARRLGQAALESVLKNYSALIVTEKYLRLFEKIIRT